ncbi:MAG: hypothetical protein KGI38_10935 [Thaumarchaeota archaeon]|nr:hypothetical protein [Nitrososphaerota archaeon]
MFEEEEEESSHRRSKTEMVCDLMLAISKGSHRPTKIMQKANLTWNALLLYLNALAVNGLVWREERGVVSFYHLTDKGKAALQAYLTLREELGSLKLESIDTKDLVNKLKAPPGAPPEEGERQMLVARLEGSGYKILSDMVKGKSGVEHTFGVVAKDKEGVTHGYVFASQPDEQIILGLFIRQLDTGFKVHVVHRAEATRNATERAKEYGIELTKLEKSRVGASEKRVWN